MKRLVILLSILNVLASSCEALLPGEVYWNNVLPKTPMPKIIETLLKHSDEFYDQSDSNAVETTKELSDNHIALWNTVKPIEPLPDNNFPWIYKAAKPIEPLPDNNFPWIYKAAKPTEPLPDNNFPRIYKATKPTEPLPAKPSKPLPDDNMIFSEEKLQRGDKVTLSLVDPSVYDVAFISQKESKYIPFASSKLPDILRHFLVDPNSLMGEAMKETLTYCEASPGEGEIKSCLTSLESLVDFCTRTLGTRDIVARSTTANKENPPKQQYEIMSINKINSKANKVMCHLLSYPYAVFHCHQLRGVEAYEVSLAGTDGIKVDAVAVCHKDTSWWDPNHIAFRILGVKPGTVPVCHFLPQYDVIWASKN